VEEEQQAAASDELQAETPVGTQVVFRFGEDTEVRYVERVPERGERVMHHGGAWEVATIEIRGDYKTTCILLPASARERSVTSDLMERVPNADRDQIAWNLPRRRRT
jgi:hypothetical protein